MFWTYSNTGNFPDGADVAAIVGIIGNKVALAKIGAAGAAAFGSVGWPLIGVAGMGHAAYRLFKLADRMAEPAEDPAP